MTDADTPGDAALLDAVHQALSTGHPLDLLGVTSMLIEAGRPDPLSFLKSHEEREPVDLEYLVDSFIELAVPETTALLTVLAELLDDAELQGRCRTALAARHDELPRWLTEFPRVEVRKAVRMTHVLGDSDEILIGARLAGGDEITCAALLDHDLMSVIKDAFFVPDTLDNVVSFAAQNNIDPDTSFVDMTLADARAWLQQGPDNPLFWAESDSWPGCRPLLQWLIAHLPEGGTEHETPEWDSDELSGAFFDSSFGAAFRRRDYDELLEAILDAAQDPLRWSVPRVERVLDDSYDDIPVTVALGAPKLLRAFIPFAHAQSGIGDELTAEAIAAIDSITSAHTDGTPDVTGD